MYVHIIKKKNSFALCDDSSPPSDDSSRKTGSCKRLYG